MAAPAPSPPTALPCLAVRASGGSGQTVRCPGNRRGPRALAERRHPGRMLARTARDEDLDRVGTVGDRDALFCLAIVWLHHLQEVGREQVGGVAGVVEKVALHVLAGPPVARDRRRMLDAE